MATLLIAVYIADHGRLLGRYRSQRMNLDRAFLDEGDLTVHLERLLAAKVHRVSVRRVDLVNDTTVVDVRYDAPAPAGQADVMPEQITVGGRS